MKNHKLLLVLLGFVVTQNVYSMNNSNNSSSDDSSSSEEGFSNEDNHENNIGNYLSTETYEWSRNPFVQNNNIFKRHLQMHVNPKKQSHDSINYNQENNNNNNNDTNSNHKQNEKEQECAICFEIINSKEISVNQIEFECAHNNDFCLKCLAKLVIFNKNVTCPLCRAQQKKDTIKKN